MTKGEVSQFKSANRALWDEWTAIHEKSEFYDVEGFKAGKLRLDPLERAELGDVTGKSLLHLQCHFGLGTLSWARLGAKATGVDFSERAITLARSLAAELLIPAEFVCSDIDHLPRALSGQFDIVFTSYGVLLWLPDLQRWAEVIAYFLKPGGTFYIAEFHPIAYIFDEGEDISELTIRYPYFTDDAPMEWKVQGSYADRSAAVSQSVSYEWMHTVGDVISALAAAGLRIEFFHEFPYTVHRQFPFMDKGDDSLWRLRDKGDSVPLLFSLRATKA